MGRACDLDLVQELKERCEKARWLPPTYDFLPSMDGKGFLCRLSIVDAGAWRPLRHKMPCSLSSWLSCQFALGNCKPVQCHM